MHNWDMEAKIGKRIAKTKLALTKRAVEGLKPADKSWIAWDDRLTGFGVRVHPTGAKSFIVNYRSGDGGRKAPNKRVVIGRYGKVAPDQARRLAQRVLGKVARAFSDHSGSYPELTKKFAHSVGVNSSMISAMAAQRSSTVRAAAFLSNALSFEKACSMGLKSGE